MLGCPSRVGVGLDKLLYTVQYIYIYIHIYILWLVWDQRTVMLTFLASATWYLTESDCDLDPAHATNSGAGAEVHTQRRFS